MTLPFALTDAQAKSLAGAAAAVSAFLLTQSDVTVAPVVKVALGAFIVFLAALGITGSKSE